MKLCNEKTKKQESGIFFFLNVSSWNRMGFLHDYMVGAVPIAGTGRDRWAHRLYFEANDSYCLLLSWLCQARLCLSCWS